HDGPRGPALRHRRSDLRPAALCQAAGLRCRDYRPAGVRPFRLRAAGRGGTAMITLPMQLLQDWSLIQHSARSDYGEDAYTLWPDAAILRGLSATSAGLIAAAPDLLEALDYLLEQTVDMDLNYGISLSEGEEEARAKALAAIA